MTQVLVGGWQKRFPDVRAGGEAGSTGRMSSALTFQQAATASLSLVVLGTASACGGDRTDEAAPGPTRGSVSASASSTDGAPSSSSAPVTHGPMLTIPQAKFTLPADGPDSEGWRFTRSARLQLASAAFDLPDGSTATTTGDNILPAILESSQVTE